MVSHIGPALTPSERRVGRGVCRAWAAWLPLRNEPPPGGMRGPSVDEVDRLCGRLRRNLSLSWNEGTETYLRETLPRLAVLGERDTTEATERRLDHMYEVIERLYARSFLAPKSILGEPITVWIGWGYMYMGWGEGTKFHRRGRFPKGQHWNPRTGDVRETTIPRPSTPPGSLSV